MKRLTLFVLSVMFIIGMLFAPQMAKAEYPESTVKLIIPYSPGGSTDTVFRIVTPAAEEELGETIAVTNMPGAGASKGSRFVKDADSDGYTLLGSHDVISTSYHSGITDYSFDAFEPICLLTSTPNMVVVNADSQFYSIDQLFNYAKENPGELSFTYTAGSTSFFFYKGLIEAAGVSPDVFREVSIEGSGTQNQRLLGGHIDVMMGNIGTSFEFVKSGDLRILAVAHEERMPQIPTVPTLKEEGIDFVHATDRGVFAPKGTSEDKIEVIANAFKKATSSEEVQNKIADAGSVINYKGPEEYSEFLEQLDNFYKKQMQ